MKVIGYVIVALFVIVVLLLVIANVSDPSPSDATSFVEKGVRNAMKDPDSATFDSVRFYPDESPQGEVISGVVCGYVNGKNSFNAYTGRVRFFSRITVSNNGRTANYSSPAIEEPSNSVSVGGMDNIWRESCK
ncbi:hypothetical protein [Serratia fonticola]|uniref:hypothetical protein n=1 Tax=Serratia fonticola TaxID=47917 RepID=UPI00141999B5|nr:hypothetical protein [Serratia fonticola]NXZ88683.1 hypothetical protein [Serratia fonticola]